MPTLLSFGRRNHIKANAFSAALHKLFITLPLIRKALSAIPIHDCASVSSRTKSVYINQYCTIQRR
jgi:hypothetical protein